MRDLLVCFVQDEEGATAIEYALIAALMAIMAIASLRALSSSMVTMYGEIEDAVDGAAQGN